jgi:hypothetical protein
MTELRCGILSGKVVSAACVSTHAFKVKETLLRRLGFLAELVDEVCKFHGGDDQMGLQGLIAGYSDLGC